MCFSAGASFGAGAVLSVIGVATVRKAATNPQRIFGSIPLLFAVQQVAEGMLWLTFNHPGLLPWQPLFTYIFLFFAVMLWPLWIPLSVRLLETKARNKRPLNILLGIGIALFLAIGVVLFTHPVQVMAMHHHLHYRFELPTTTRGAIWFFTILYCLCTIVAPFLSEWKRMKWLGFAFLVSYLLAVLLFQGFVVSVWCFFAALLSGVVYWIIREKAVR